jgi:hypothetical protein
MRREGTAMTTAMITVLLVGVGVLLVLLGWSLGRYGRSGSRPAPAMALIPARPGTSQEREPLVDGLILGHALTRGHYEDRVAGEMEGVASRRSEAEEHRDPADGAAEEFDDKDDR